MTQTVTPYLLYADCAAALDWLTRAFGFEEVLRHTGDDGSVNHAEMKVGEGRIYMGDPGDHYRNPKQLGQDTVWLYVLVDDVDAHHQRATAAGAEILRAPEDQEYGDRRYDVVDPEGHRWYFAQRVQEAAPDDWGAEVPT